MKWIKDWSAHLLEGSIVTDKKIIRGVKISEIFEKGDLREIKALLDDGLDPNEEITFSYITAPPLYELSYLGRADAIKLFIERGANPNFVTKSGVSPIFTATYHGHLEAVEELLKGGADPDIHGKGPDEMVALEVACMRSQPEIAKLLIEYGADIHGHGGRSTLRMATLYTKPEIVKMLIDHGADVTEQDKSGDTLLHEAVNMNNKEMIKLFLEEGVDPDILNNEGFTALHKAAIKHNPIMVDLLLVGGADPEVRSESTVPNKNGKTALELAAWPYIYKGDGLVKSTVKRLIQAGSNPSSVFDTLEGFKSIFDGDISWCPGGESGAERRFRATQTRKKMF